MSAEIRFGEVRALNTGRRWKRRGIAGGAICENWGAGAYLDSGHNPMGHPDVRPRSQYAPSIRGRNTNANFRTWEEAFQTERAQWSRFG